MQTASVERYQEYINPNKDIPCKESYKSTSVTNTDVKFPTSY